MKNIIFKLNLQLFATGHYPKNPKQGQELQTDVTGLQNDRGFISHLSLSATEAVAASTTGVHAAVTDNGAQQVITADITNPPFTRCITATAGGTAGDIKAIQVTVVGTNINDEVITEILPVFTVDTAGTVVGLKAFKTVTSITIPAHDGTGATTAIGFGDKIGLPDLLPGDTVNMVLFGGTREATAATVTASTTALESNTVDLNSALDGSVVDIFYIA